VRCLDNHTRDERTVVVEGKGGHLLLGVLQKLSKGLRKAIGLRIADVRWNKGAVRESIRRHGKGRKGQNGREGMHVD